MTKISDKFLKPYEPKETEDKIYKKWLNSGYFNPDNCIKDGICEKDTEKFSMVLPPPNVTGVLHMGHASMLAIEDILIRFERMKGKKTLWLPGTDHAAIATQTKVEKILVKQEKKNRHDLGRAEFLKRADKYAQESHDTIIHQIQKMGSSVDWDREAFTLDEDRRRAVYTAFKNMYNDGLIYQGHRTVNWDPKGQTTISDDEIVRVEEKAKFYYFKYGPFIIGTTRPETKFGDKYVVMHPDDKRYKKYKHGQKIDLEWINGPITATVIKDEASDMEMGSGVMTITPWHSGVDFEIAEKYNLDKEQIIDKYGKMLPVAEEFAGMKITEAREKIVEKLEKKGLLVKVEEDYIHQKATAERSGGIIEPQIMKQWFIGVNKEFKVKNSKIDGIKTGSKTTLKKLMQQSVRGGQIDIMPERFKKIYFHWIDNLHDWCISRQIWYGHQIPVWYKGKEIYCGTEAPKENGWEQDPDTLDTWFSSGLWTFSTLGWPNKTSDMETYHPTNVLETGYDILFPWVARMILMTTYHLGEIPFKHVYLHGLVRDSKGRKMSKSLGNAMNPLDMTEKYGADATRMSLVIGSAVGNDINLSEDKIRAYKKFANKIWNASRFVVTQLEDFDIDSKPELTRSDQKLIDELTKFSKEITDDLENFRLHLSAEKLYHYFWHNFADVIIEDGKKKISSGTEEEKMSTQHMLWTFLKIQLKLLHPFMPFVTEEIWGLLPHNKERLLMVSIWPN